MEFLWDCPGLPKVDGHQTLAWQRFPLHVVKVCPLHRTDAVGPNRSRLDRGVGIVLRREDRRIVGSPLDRRSVVSFGSSRFMAVEGKPDGWLPGVGGLDAVTAVSGDEKRIAGP